LVGNYKLKAEAKKDILDAAEWYELQQYGVGESFYHDVLEKIEDISKRPKGHPTFYKEYRRASLKKFPYWIVYIIKEPTILILSVWHKKRNPEFLIRNVEKRTINDAT